jgi:hypothetical protein
MLKILTPKQAEKKRIGSFYHPTKETYRTGVCPKGEILKNSYTKKNGTKVDQSCIKNSGLPGKVFDKYKVIKLKKTGVLKEFGYTTKLSAKERLNSLLKAVKALNYREVALRISALRTLHKNDENQKYYNIFNKDLEGLKKWRVAHPNLYKPLPKKKNK